MTTHSLSRPPTVSQCLDSRNVWQCLKRFLVKVVQNSGTSCTTFLFSSKPKVRHCFWHVCLSKSSLLRLISNLEIFRRRSVKIRRNIFGKSVANFIAWMAEACRSASCIQKFKLDLSSQFDSTVRGSNSWLNLVEPIIKCGNWSIQLADMHFTSRFTGFTGGFTL